MLEVKIPDYPLNQFVEYFLCFDEVIPEHSIDRFLPDGNTEIVIDLTDSPKFIYDNETFEEKQTCTNSWASGVRTDFITIPSGQDSAMFVIYFKKGMAYPFFPVPMNEMADCVVNTDLLWRNEYEYLREMLLAEPDIGRRFSLAESFLLRHFKSKMEINPCVTYAVDQILDQPDQVSLGKLYEKIGYSGKHFTEMFKIHVGVTPKAYLKISRFQKAIVEIEQNRSIVWSAIAQDAGFYDQAHFINDFKRFSGFTPKDYFDRKNGNLNYVPVA